MYVVLQVVLTIETKGFDYHDKHSELFLRKQKYVSIGTIPVEK